MYKTLFNAFDDLKNKSIEYYTHNLKSTLDLNNSDPKFDKRDQSEPSHEDKDIRSKLFNLDWKIEDMVNAANKASQLLRNTLVDTANVVKINFEENNIISDFKKEQEKFQNEILNPHDSSLIAWNGFENEENLKKQILSLSQDMRNFLRSPPDSSDFSFDFASYANSAKEMLKLDPRLRAMRFQLVPKKIKEELFWRNYFYRVSLTKQSINLYDNIPTNTSRKDSCGMESVKDRVTGVGSVAKVATLEGSVDPLRQGGGGDDEQTLTQTEFISDSIIKEEDGYLSSTSGEKLNLDEELEKMLGDDLKEYELVKKTTSESNQSQNGSSFNDDPEWDKELQEMLENQKS